jgi:predicted O-methyltransferase YrrM
MISGLKYALKYIQYTIFAKHKKGHGIHSPFMFRLIQEVFNKKDLNSDLKAVFSIHKRHKRSKQKLSYNEIGAGSSYRTKKNQSLGKIIKRSSVSRKYGKLIYNIINHFAPTDILELGSSVGISSAYIAQAAKESNFISIEGVNEKLNVAKHIAQELNLSTKFICGDFDEILDFVLNEYKQLDFAFFDGNHTKKSTIKYFESCLDKIHNNTIFIFDDIHWSDEMESAWEYIKLHKDVRVSVDLFQMGLIFFRKELSYEHYTIKY